MERQGVVVFRLLFGLAIIVIIIGGAFMIYRRQSSGDRKSNISKIDNLDKEVPLISDRVEEESSSDISQPFYIEATFEVPSAPSNDSSVVKNRKSVEKLPEECKIIQLGIPSTSRHICPDVIDRRLGFPRNLCYSEYNPNRIVVESPYRVAFGQGKRETRRSNESIKGFCNVGNTQFREDLDFYNRKCTNRQSKYLTPSDKYNNSRSSFYAKDLPEEDISSGFSLFDETTTDSNSEKKPSTSSSIEKKQDKSAGSSSDKKDYKPKEKNISTETALDISLGKIDSLSKDGDRHKKKDAKPTVQPEKKDPKEIDLKSEPVPAPEALKLKELEKPAPETGPITKPEIKSAPDTDVKPITVPEELKLVPAPVLVSKETVAVPEKSEIVLEEKPAVVPVPVEVLKSELESAPVPVPAPEKPVEEPKIEQKPAEKKSAPEEKSKSETVPEAEPNPATKQITESAVEKTGQVILQVVELESVPKEPVKPVAESVQVTDEARLVEVPENPKIVAKIKPEVEEKPVKAEADELEAELEAELDDYELDEEELKEEARIEAEIREKIKAETKKEAEEEVKLETALEVDAEIKAQLEVEIKAEVDPTKLESKNRIKRYIINVETKRARKLRELRERSRRRKEEEERRIREEKAKFRELIRNKKRIKVRL